MYTTEFTIRVFISYTYVMIYRQCYVLLFSFVGLVGSGHSCRSPIRWTLVNANAATSPVQVAISQSYSYTLSTLSCTVDALLGTVGVRLYDAVVLARPVTLHYQSLDIAPHQIKH